MTDKARVAMSGQTAYGREVPVFNLWWFDLYSNLAGNVVAFYIKKSLYERGFFDEHGDGPDSGL